MDKKKIIKFIIPICVVLVVAGIWVIKNLGESPAQERLPAHEDFALEADSIDLESLTSHGIPIIIDFGSDSCIPCKEMAPVLKTLNDEMQGVAIIKFVDVWKNTAASADFPIEVIPTQVFITADGKPYIPSDGIADAFRMYNNKDTGEHAFTVHQGSLTEEQLRIILAEMGVSE